MTAKNILSVTSVLLFLFFYGCDRPEGDTPASSGERNEIVVAMDIDMPGYFAVDGETFGLQYELLKAYADETGLGLKVIEKTTLSDKKELFKGNRADMAALLSAHAGGKADVIPLYSTSFVMLAGKHEARRLNKDNALPPGKILSGKRLLISSAFKTTRTYSMLLDSLGSGADISVSSRGCVELAHSLRDGKYDYLICEKSEARAGMALVLGLSKVYDFKETAEVGLALNSNTGGLREDFAEWLGSYRKGNDYAMLKELYLGDGELTGLSFKSHERTGRKSISAYDNIMREICGREGMDWRLVSAIAYHESRFKADVVSNKGASGLMQIMPSVARQFDVPQQDILKPEVNIMLAVKLIRRIESSLKLPADMSYDDRMSIILACYNCGIGHVSDARRLAAKYGGNPNSWSDVSLYLERKAHPEYISDDVVKCGKLSSGGSRQTLAFVSNVMGKYTSYCSKVKR